MLVFFYRRNSFQIIVSVEIYSPPWNFSPQRAPEPSVKAKETILTYYCIDLLAILELTFFGDLSPAFQELNRGHN